MIKDMQTGHPSHLWDRHTVLNSLSFLENKPNRAEEVQYEKARQ